MHLQRTDDRTLASYDQYLDDERRRRIADASGRLADARVAHVNSTASGGGVAEMIGSLVPLTNDRGIDADWLVMDAPAEFFDVTKAIHNGLQGEAPEFTGEMRETYRRVTDENAAAFEGGYDAVVLHDPQTLGMAGALAERFPDVPLVWRCHIDVTTADPAYLEFVRSRLDHVDRAIVSRPEFGETLSGVETTVVHPAIDPLTEKNCPLEDLTGEAAAAASMEEYPFGADAPLLVQVSRFDPWKDPLGVIEAYERVTAEVPDAQLALVGSMPDDDPEGIEVYREVERAADDPGVHLLTNVPDAAINAIQRRADVVLQKSIREGFALTVSEALWKRTPVVGSNVGGIPLQVEDGENGYLVEPDDVAATADRVGRLLSDESRNREFGDRGRERVREKFLLPRLLLDYLDVLADALDER